MTNEQCVNRLICYLCDCENQEMFLLEHDGDEEDLREVEMDIEAFRRAIQALGGE